MDPKDKRWRKARRVIRKRKRPRSYSMTDLLVLLESGKISETVFEAAVIDALRQVPASSNLPRPTK